MIRTGQEIIDIIKEQKLENKDLELIIPMSIYRGMKCFRDHKLTSEELNDIFEQRINGVTLKVLSAKYGVSIGRLSVLCKEELKRRAAARKNYTSLNDTIL